MNNKLLKIEQGLIEFLLLKDSINLIVLQNQHATALISVLSSSNGKYDFNPVKLDEGKNKFSEVLSNFDKNDFFLFGNENQTLFAIRKTFVLSFVKVIEPTTLAASYNIVDKQNNRYNIGIDLSEEAYNNVIDAILN